MIGGAVGATIVVRFSGFTKSLEIMHFADITPDVSLLAKVGQSGHSVAEAVAELVDNAIDAAPEGGRIEVEIEYSTKEGWIEIRDDGSGMNRAALADALVLGLSGKTDGEIGRFGLGLKTACTSLGSRFQIITTTDDSKVDWIADYDEEEFLSSGEWMLPISRQKSTRVRGTRIRIYSSRIYSGLSQSLLRNLGSTFRHFIDDDVLHLSLNGETVEAVHQEVDQESVLPLEGSVLGHQVRGWVGLLVTSSQRGWYGFSLVRNRRVIRRHEKLGFRSHPSTARVVGELHLDDLPVNNLKTDFIRETETWHALERWVSEQIEPVLAVSRSLAHAGTFDSGARAAIAEERERILAALGPSEAHLMPPRRPHSASSSGAVNIVLGTMHMVHYFEAAGSSAPHCREEAMTRVDDPDLLVVSTNTDHPAMTASDPSIIACHNLAEVATLRMADPVDFIPRKGQLLSLLLEQKPVRRALRLSLKGGRAAPTEAIRELSAAG
jgi:hypothetical protein